MMASFKLWKVRRTIRAEGSRNSIVSVKTCGGDREHEAIEEAKSEMPYVSIEFAARELTDAEYAEHYKRQNDGC